MTKISTLDGVVKIKKADGRLPLWDAKDAVGFWRAKDYSGAGVIPDLSDNAHDLTNFGAKFLPFDGEKYLYFPGLNDNNISTPDAPEFDLAGDADFRFDTGEIGLQTIPADGILKTLVSRWDQSNSYLIYAVDGAIGFYMAPASNPGGANVVFSTQTFQNVRYVKVTRVLSTGVVKFWSSADGSTWIQEGPNMVLYPGEAIASGNAPIFLGGRSADIWPYEGRLKSFEIRDGIDGPVAASWSADDMGQTGGVSGGKTWTINRATTGLKSVLVDRPLFLLAPDDYLETPDHADFNFGTNDSFSIVAVVRRHHNMATDVVLVGKAASGTLGWRLWVWNGDSGTYMTINDGVINSQESYPPPALSIVAVHAGVRDVSSDKIEVHINGENRGAFTTDATTGPLTNTNHVRIGRDVGGNTAYMDGEFMGAAIFRRALSDEEIAEVGETLGAG